MNTTISNALKQAVVIATAIAMIYLVGWSMLRVGKDEARFEQEEAEAFAVAMQEYTEVEMNVSAYCSGECCCGQFADGITASGVLAVGKMIAAPKTYAFKTKMDIPGYGTALVQDRGGAIKGNKLDLLFDSHQAALNWGRKQLTVKVYK